MSIAFFSHWSMSLNLAVTILTDQRMRSQNAHSLNVDEIFPYLLSIWLSLTVLKFALLILTAAIHRWFMLNVWLTECLRSRTLTFATHSAHVDELPYSIFRLPGWISYASLDKLLNVYISQSSRNTQVEMHCNANECFHVANFFTW